MKSVHEVQLLSPVSLAIPWEAIKVQPANPSSGSPYSQWTFVNFPDAFTVEIM